MAHKGSASGAAIRPPWPAKVFFAVPAIGAIAIYIFIAVSRMAYPFTSVQNSPALAALLNPYLAALQQRSREQVNGTFLVPDDQYAQSFSTGPYTCRSLAAEGLLLRQFAGAQAYNSWLCIHTPQ